MTDIFASWQNSAPVLDETEKSAEPFFFVMTQSSWSDTPDEMTQNSAEAIFLTRWHWIQLKRYSWQDDTELSWSDNIFLNRQHWIQLKCYSWQYHTEFSWSVILYDITLNSAEDLVLTKWYWIQIIWLWRDNTELLCLDLRYAAEA